MIENVYCIKTRQWFHSHTKHTYRVLARFTSLLFAMRTLIYGRYCIQKSNYDYFHPHFDMIVFKMKRSSFPVVLNKQTQPQFLLLAIFFHWFAPWETMWHCFYPISPWARAKMAGIVNNVYCRIEKKNNNNKKKQQHPRDIAPLSTLAGGLDTNVSYSAVCTLYVTALTRWQLYWLVQLVKRGGISWGEGLRIFRERKSQLQQKRKLAS